MRSVLSLRFVAAVALALQLIACGSAALRPAATAGGGAAAAAGAKAGESAKLIEAKKEITGFGPFDFDRTSTIQEVEEAGEGRLTTVSPGEIYFFTPYERFDGLGRFLPSERKGQVPPARRKSGPAPQPNAAELRLRDGRLWLIILYFNPNDYDEYLRVIGSEYGEPSDASQKNTDALRRDVWLRGGRCIILEQVVLTNVMNGGQLAIQKDRCEGAKKN